MRAVDIAAAAGRHPTTQERRRAVGESDGRPCDGSHARRRSGTAMPSILLNAVGWHRVQGEDEIMLLIVDMMNQGVGRTVAAVIEAGGADASIPLLVGAILAGGWSLALAPSRR